MGTSSADAMQAQWRASEWEQIIAKAETEWIGAPEPAGANRGVKPPDRDRKRASTGAGKVLMAIELRHSR